MKALSFPALLPILIILLLPFNAAYPADPPADSVDSQSPVVTNETAENPQEKVSEEKSAPAEETEKAPDPAPEKPAVKTQDKVEEPSPAPVEKVQEASGLATVEKIEDKIKEIAASIDLSKDAKEEMTKRYRAVLSNLDIAASNEKAADEFLKTRKTATRQTRDIRQELEQMRASSSEVKGFNAFPATN